MWHEIELKLKFNLESNWIWTLRFLHSIIHFVQNKIKIRWDLWCKIENPIKSNLIFFEFWLYIYIYIKEDEILRSLPISCLRKTSLCKLSLNEIQLLKLFLGNLSKDKVVELILIHLNRVHLQRKIHTSFIASNCQIDFGYRSIGALSPKDTISKTLT